MNSVGNFERKLKTTFVNKKVNEKLLNANNLPIYTTQ